MKKNKNKRPGHLLRIPVKCLILAFLLLLNLSFFVYNFHMVRDEITWDQDGYQKEHMLKLISEDDYGSLFDTLVLYDLYTEEYADLWTVADAWRLSCIYKAACSSALQAESPEQVSFYEGKAIQAYAALLQIPPQLENQTAGAAVARIQKQLYSD